MNPEHSFLSSCPEQVFFVLTFAYSGRPRADDIWRKATTANNDVYCRRVMQVMNEYIGIGVSFVLAGGITALMVLLSSTLGKKNPTPVKLAPFECGKEPFSLPVGRFAIKFYLIGILFILFDVELVFLYPWAVVYHALGLSGLIDIGVFLGILMVGFVYAWDNGALNWR